jgi:hypothetical protein
MKLTFDRSQCFAVPDAFLSILNSTLDNITPPDANSEVIIFNFRDPDYSAKDGGFHPVEIRLVRHHELWQFAYITDFSFQGSPYPELVVDIDVCFISKGVYSIYGGWLDKTSGEELKELFLANFIAYVEMEVFKVEVAFH